MPSSIRFPYTTLIALVVVQLYFGLMMGDEFSSPSADSTGGNVNGYATAFNLPAHSSAATIRMAKNSQEHDFVISCQKKGSVSALPGEQEPNRLPSQMHHPTKVWYSHPDIRRDRSEIVGNEEILLRSLMDNSYSKFILSTPKGMYYHFLQMNEDGDSESSKNDITTTMPLYLSPMQIDDILRASGHPTLQVLGSETDEKTGESSNDQLKTPLLIWVGSRDGINYWAIHLWTHDDNLDDIIDSNLNLDTSGKEIECYNIKRLREFGDTIVSSFHAGITATANGFIEFHKSHKFCTMCGSPTHPAKVGSCRQCSNSISRGRAGGTCKSRSVYPRIDVATIMLITSPCDQYALLGRKANWPSGRYSTLAGFCEVGETLEQCCIRETYEESGVHVDESSVKFVASQPWPFPRSLMVGFHAKAKKSVVTDRNSESSSLPQIIIDTNEMEDIQWFHKDFVRNGLTSSAGSTALTYQPNDEESIFHFPGRSSLARVLITKWALDD